MKLSRVSLLSITGCLVGLVLLLLLGAISLEQRRTKQKEIRELSALDARIDAFSAGSDALLVYPPDPVLWKAFRSEAQSIQQTLSAMTEKFPTAQRAMHYVESIIDALEAANVTGEKSSTAPPEPATPLRTRIIMNRVAGYGVALDSTLGDMLNQHQTRIAREANWTGAVFAGAGTLFGMLSILAFWILLRKINGPLRSLLQAAYRVEAGETGVRVPVAGSDEFADLSRIFNQMLDQQVATVDALSDALTNSNALINSLPAHIAVLDVSGKIVNVNDQWRHYGLTNDNRDANLGIGSNYLDVCRAASGDSSEEALDAADGLQSVLVGNRHTFELEYPCHSPDQLHWFRMVSTRLEPGAETESTLGAAVMHVDITERKLAEKELERRAYQDPLTGLANRLGFIEALERYHGEHGWEPQDIIALLDIQEMRNINDAHGYDVGDRLLLEMACRLEDRLCNPGLLGRISGDQFIVLLPAVDTSPLHDRLKDLADIFHQPIQLLDLVIEVAASGGYTLQGDEQRSAEALLHEVEIALHEAHEHHKNAFNRYDKELDTRAQQRIELTRELRLALEHDQFELHYQPKVDLETGKIIGCEALIRWMHPTRGMQMPGQFIPVAEQSQLIGPIGDWVLFQACRNLQEWQEAGLDLVRVSVNVSVDQFRSSDFPGKVQEALETHDISPAALTLEITESVFSEESEAMRQRLNRLHALGVKLSLDDFGTGYSSLLYLQRYPFDEIKIDMGFVRGILDDSFNRNIVSMILGIGRALKADTVAEGVENTVVRDALLDLGCRVGQGYHYSMPLEVEDFRWLLEKHSLLPLTPQRDAAPQPGHSKA